MRVHHTQHLLPAFPVYSAAFIGDDRLVLGGGGGASKSGIKNALRLYKVSNGEPLELLDDYELENGEDTPMSIAADIENLHVVCGINSNADLREKGKNMNCRLFSIKDDEFELSASTSTLNIKPVNLDDYQRVTVYSPDFSFVAVAGQKDLSVLSYPSLDPVGASIHTDHEIYDATFSSSKIVVATTHNLLVYAIPADELARSETEGRQTRSRIKQKVKAQSSMELKLLKKIERPTIKDANGSYVFRAARFLPGSEKTLYTVLNITSARTNGKSSKQGYICKWNTEKWVVRNTKKAGERGITCFDISSNGKFLAFGSANLSIGLMDAQTLSPVTSIFKAHEFPPTTVRFSPNSSLLVSGSVDNAVRVITVPTSAESSSSPLFMITIALIILFVALFAAFLLNLKRL